MLSFIFRSMAFVAIFVSGVVYSILGSITPLWIGIVVLLAMMMADLGFNIGKICCSLAGGDSVYGNICRLLLVVTFYGHFLLMMIASFWIAENRFITKGLGEMPLITIDISGEFFR